MYLIYFALVGFYGISTSMFFFNAKYYLYIYIKYTVFDFVTF